MRGVDGQEVGAVFGGDHLAAAIAGAIAVAGRQRIGIHLQHLAQGLLQLFEGVLANAGVRLVEGQAGRAQQVAQVAFGNRREAQQQVSATRLR